MSTMTRHQGPVTSYWDDKQPPKSIIDAIVCPPWCVGHHIDGEDVEGRAIFHYGPRFDTLGASPALSSWVDGRIIEGLSIPLNIDIDVDISRIREVIAELTRAAEWLEANS